MAFTDSQTIDRWLRRHQPRTELAMRCSIRTHFDAAKNSAAFSSRIDELLVAIHPTDDEHACIQRCSREIGSAMAKLLRDQSGGVLATFVKARSNSAALRSVLTAPLWRCLVRPLPAFRVHLARLTCPHAVLGRQFCRIERRIVPARNGVPREQNEMVGHEGHMNQVLDSAGA
jgi:hypothetical protein